MPKKLIKVILVLFLLLGTPGWFFSARAAEAKICQECHTQKFLQQNFAGSLEKIAYGDQSVYQGKLNPCLGIRFLAEDLFFTESRLQKYASILYAENKDQIKVQELNKIIHQIEAELEILKKQKVDYHLELTKSMAALRLSLQKVYEQIWQMRTEKEKRWLMGIGGLFFLVVCGLFLVALQKLTRIGKIPVIIIFLTVNLILANCSVKLGETPKGKAPEQLDQALAIAQKSVKEIEDAYHKIIVLIDLAKEYGPVDAPAAKQTWKLAREIATSIKEKNKEIIPQLEMVASSLGLKMNSDSKSELQEKIDQIQGGIFLLRLLAEEWIAVDLKEGRQILEIATEEVLRLPPRELRDRQLKALGEIWSNIESEEALKLISKIKDPFWRTMSLGRLALTHPDKEPALVFLQKAAHEASFISPPWRQVHALIRLAAWAAQIKQEEGEKYAELTWYKIEGLADQELQSWAGQEMIRSWAPINGQKAEGWLKKIPEKFAASRVYSLLHIGQAQSSSQKPKYLRQALAEVRRISDEYERRKLWALIFQDLLPLDQREALKNFRELKDPYVLSQLKPKIWRAMAITDSGSGLKLAQNIGTEELRYPLILELLKDLLPSQREELLNLFKEAFQLTNYISMPYQRWLILRGLSEKWGRLDAEGQVACLKEVEKTLPQISFSGQKAEILAYLAASWKSLDEEKSRDFLGKHAREKHGPQHILEEIRLWGKFDIKKAKDLAQKLSAEFSLERIQAYKEMARLLKKENPQEAWKYLEIAWQEAQKVSPNAKIMVELAKEGAEVNKEGIGELIFQIPIRRERDTLLQELAKALIKTGQIADLETAWQISKEITDTSLVLDLYEKIEKLIKTKKWEQGLTKSNWAELLVLQNWPAPKEKLEEGLLPIKDQKLKARLLAFFATNLAQVDEEGALQIGQKISGIDQEAYSFALYKIGSKFRKWNRAQGQNVLEQALRAAEQIKEEDLRRERIHQLAKELYYLEENLAQNILRKLLADFSLAPKDISLTLVEWYPHLTKKIAQEVKNPYDQAQIILRGAEVLLTKGWAENNKLLEAAAQWAKRIDSARWQGEVAEILILCAEQKGWELWGQIGNPEERVKILIKIGQRKNHMPPEKGNRILEKALAETFKITDTHKRIKFLVDIARAWMPQNKQKGREILSQAQQIALHSPEFIN